MSGIRYKHVQKVDAYNVSVGKANGRRPLLRPTRRWEDVIKIHVKETRIGGHGLDLCDSG
jgi:hypothetical protein